MNNGPSMEIDSPSLMAATLRQQAGDFFALTKPRVVSLIVFCAFIGMLLAPGSLAMPGVLAAATLGIALVAGAAAALNCLIEQNIDRLMARTRARQPPWSGRWRCAAWAWRFCSTGSTR